MPTSTTSKCGARRRRPRRRGVSRRPLVVQRRRGLAAEARIEQFSAIVDRRSAVGARRPRGQGIVAPRKPAPGLAPPGRHPGRLERDRAAAPFAVRFSELLAQAGRAAAIAGDVAEAQHRAAGDRLADELEIASAKGHAGRRRPRPDARAAMSPPGPPRRAGFEPALVVENAADPVAIRPRRRDRRRWSARRRAGPRRSGSAARCRGSAPTAPPGPSSAPARLRVRPSGGRH